MVHQKDFMFVGAFFVENTRHRKKLPLNIQADYATVYVKISAV